MKNWLTHLKRPWCWERLKAGGEGDNRGWDGWMASLTQWTWVWVNSGSLRWIGRPGVLQSMGSQRVGYNRATELRLQRTFLGSPPLPGCPSGKLPSWPHFMWSQSLPQHSRTCGSALSACPAGEALKCVVFTTAYLCMFQFSLVQLLSCAQLFVTHEP